jgi:hypothetical protein
MKEPGSIEFVDRYLNHARDSIKGDQPLEAIRDLCAVIGNAQEAIEDLTHIAAEQAATE